ncbi:FAD-dependent oxidoreductase [Actinomadura darangshiensis]|uniref:FAD-dependent oxidoreductase n=1 Tax=Actinomadura darangshiensis TaxID=705336 RepID=A0A4V2YV64_9ACTN|nr:FAD-dependent oxidoreductase [Actinomadura darangshiensis]TDD80327.1 FAD-dependent oxidoreductase [Actinomadura darangshiensis]
MAERLTATVIGGGIAGLASAAALVQAGWRVTVLERAPDFTEVGAGVAITRNGMAALAALGVDDRVRAAGHMTRTAGSQDRHGRWILRVPEVPVNEDPTSRLCAVHRQRLHAVLLRAAEAADLVNGARVTAVEPGAPAGAAARVTWTSPEGARTIESDLVVAADGVHSTARTCLFPGLRSEYGGATSWRAVIKDTEIIDDRYIAMWGPGIEFGALRISATDVYWYGYFVAPANTVFDDELAAAREMFAGWPTTVASTLAATEPGDLMRHDVYHLPKGLPAYTSGRVVMVGDAAHAILPTVGQGVASSLEDAACVGRLIAQPVAHGAPLAPAMAAYDLARRPRCRKIARQAVMMARIASHLGGGWRQPARNALLRLVPAGRLANSGFAAQLVGWTPPPAP